MTNPPSFHMPVALQPHEGALVLAVTASTDSAMTEVP